MTRIGTVALVTEQFIQAAAVNTRIRLAFIDIFGTNLTLLVFRTMVNVYVTERTNVSRVRAITRVAIYLIDASSVMKTQMLYTIINVYFTLFALVTRRAAVTLKRVDEVRALTSAARV